MVGSRKSEVGVEHAVCAGGIGSSPTRSLEPSSHNQRCSQSRDAAPRRAPLPHSTRRRYDERLSPGD